ncbi:hypothetical protein D021_3612A, partial [Vibrio parahaemolyticus 10296]
MSKYFARR